MLKKNTEKASVKSAKTRLSVADRQGFVTARLIPARDVLKRRIKHGNVLCTRAEIHFWLRYGGR